MGNNYSLLKISLYELQLNLFGRRKRCLSEKRLDGKVVVITGANTGIGKETALQMSARGAKVYIACRSVEKAESAVKEIMEKNPKADIRYVKLDLSSFKSIRDFVETMTKLEPVIDILINNAGVVGTPEDWKTADGFEMQFGTNHLGTFLVTLLLMPMLKKAPKARIVIVASDTHVVGKINLDNPNLRNGEYDPMKAYYQSKLANILFARELAKRLGKNNNITVYSLNPGHVKTEAQRHLNLGTVGQWVITKLFLTPELGAQTSLYCAIDEKLDNESGFYYDNCTRWDVMIPRATDDEMAEKLWNLSCDLVGFDDDLNRVLITTPAWENK